MHDSTSAMIVRAVTEQRPHAWCPQYGWHDVCPTDNDAETYTVRTMWHGTLLSEEHHTSEAAAMVAMDRIANNAMADTPDTVDLDVVSSTGDVLASASVVVYLDTDFRPYTRLVRD